MAAVSVEIEVLCSSYVAHNDVVTYITRRQTKKTNMSAAYRQYIIEA